MAMSKIELGKIGEDLASEYLAKNGYQIIKRNWRYSHGEIDIIAKIKNLLVFVEVKTRSNLEFGVPEYAITKNKQSQIRKMAEAYLYINEITNEECRLDVIAILLLDKNKPIINHYENAF